MSEIDIFDSKSGVKFLGIPNLPEIEFEEGLPPAYVKDFNVPLSTKAELTAECEIDAELFSRMTGANIPTDVSNFTLEGLLPHLVQVKRHKKKRINKKWAKRYGYKTVFEPVKLTNVQFFSDDYPGFTFTGTIFKE